MAKGLGKTIWLVALLLCFVGCSEEPESTGCEGDACVEADAIVEISHPYCAEAYVFGFSHGDVWVSILDPSGGAILSGASEVQIRVEISDSGELLGESTTGGDGEGFEGFTGLDEGTWARADISIMGSDEGDVKAVGGSVSYDGNMEHVAVVRWWCGGGPLRACCDLLVRPPRR